MLFWKTGLVPSTDSEWSNQNHHMTHMTRGGCNLSFQIPCSLEILIMLWDFHRPRVIDDILVVCCCSCELAKRSVCLISYAHLEWCWNKNCHTTLTTLHKSGLVFWCGIPTTYYTSVSSRMHVDKNNFLFNKKIKPCHSNKTLAFQVKKHIICKQNPHSSLKQLH